MFVMLTSQPLILLHVPTLTPFVLHQRSEAMFGFISCLIMMKFK
jgi:hypothetical protein